MFKFCGRSFLTLLVLLPFALPSTGCETEKPDEPQCKAAVDCGPSYDCVDGLCVYTDSDGDGISNEIEMGEGASGSDALCPFGPDADDDGVPNHLDDDSDGDGISDEDEGSSDANQDGVPDFLDAPRADADGDGIPNEVEGDTDTDGDGTVDAMDTDADGDGIPDAVEAGPMAASPRDADGDGTPDYLDLDSDGDGVLDADEPGDADNNGVPDAVDGPNADADGDGVSNQDEGTGDDDGDGVPNALDPDSNGDGVPDAVEADPNLSAGNIKQGVSLLGITGAYPSASYPLPGDSADNNASSAQVLSGYEAWASDGTVVDGTMPDIGAQNITPSASDQSILQGYHDGTGSVTGDVDLVAANIKTGVNLFGVDGQAEVVDTTSGDAVAGELLTGKVCWVDGSEVTGSMPNVGTQNVSPGISDITIAQGYHDGSGVVSGDADLSEWNIRSGTTIFGVSGNSNIVNTASGDATTATIQFGKKAWVDGVEITGYLAGGTSVNPAATFSPLKRWAHNGNGTITDTTTALVWYHKGNTYWGTYASCAANISNTSHLSPADLSDGSSGYSWRLPTVSEMLRLTSGVEAISPSSQYLFTGIQTGWYWTSSASTNSIPLKHMKVQMPEVLGFSVAENLLALHYGMAVRGPL